MRGWGRVPAGEEAADQRRGWLDDLRDDEHIEMLRAISPGTYALQPVHLADPDGPHDGGRMNDAVLV